MIKQLAHVCIGAKNLEETERFYRDVLGLQKGFVFMKGGKPIGFYFVVGGDTFIEVFIDTEMGDGQRPLLKHLCLEVEDIEAVVNAANSKGWPISAKVMGADHTWQAWITDPSGVAIELQQYTADSTQFTGEDCILD
jgi:lactoylglutathione lyase/glyoxylase I family protein